MTTLDTFRTHEDARRQWRRVPARFAMRCRRLGGGDEEMVVEAVDLSPGGVRLSAPADLMTGDVVVCWTDSGRSGSATGFKGLVVQARADMDQRCHAHVAWTNLSPESRDELGRLLTLHDTDEPPAGPGTAGSS